MRACHIIERHKYTVLEINECFETYVLRRDQTSMVGKIKTTSGKFYHAIIFLFKLLDDKIAPYLDYPALYFLVSIYFIILFLYICIYTVKMQQYNNKKLSFKGCTLFHRMSHTSLGDKMCIAVSSSMSGFEP